MSNNTAVTADGGEIVYSIAMQATAKPKGQCRSQIVVEWQVWRTLDARDYWQRKNDLWAFSDAQCHPQALRNQRQRRSAVRTSRTWAPMY
jgi:cobyric acid synthase